MEKYVEIKSPFTGGKVKEISTVEEHEFRKERFSVHTIGASPTRLKVTGCGSLVMVVPTTMCSKQERHTNSSSIMLAQTTMYI